METTYFILGILSVVCLITIVGIVRISSSVSQLRGTVDKLHQSLDNEVRGTQDHIDTLDRRVTEVDRDLHRYIDSRYDKLLNSVKTK